MKEKMAEMKDSKAAATVLPLLFDKDDIQVAEELEVKQENVPQIDQNKDEKLQKLQQLFKKDNAIDLAASQAKKSKGLSVFQKKKMAATG